MLVDTSNHNCNQVSINYLIITKLDPTIGMKFSSLKEFRNVITSSQHTWQTINQMLHCKAVDISLLHS